MTTDNFVKEYNYVPYQGKQNFYVGEKIHKLGKNPYTVHVDSYFWNALRTSLDKRFFNIDYKTLDNE